MFLTKEWDSILYRFLAENLYWWMDHLFDILYFYFNRRASKNITHVFLLTEQRSFLSQQLFLPNKFTKFVCKTYYSLSISLDTNGFDIQDFQHELFNVKYAIENHLE